MTSTAKLNKEALKKLKDVVLRARGALDAIQFDDKEHEALTSELEELTIDDDTLLLEQMKENLSEMETDLLRSKEKLQDLKYQISTAEQDHVESDRSVEELQLIISKGQSGYDLATMQAELRGIPEALRVNREVLEKYDHVPDLYQVQRETGMIQGRLKDLSFREEGEEEGEREEEGEDPSLEEIKSLEDAVGSFTGGQRAAMDAKMKRLASFAEYEDAGDINDIIDELQNTKNSHKYTPGAILLNEEELSNAADRLSHETVRSTSQHNSRRPTPEEIASVQEQLDRLTRTWSHREAITIVTGLPTDGTNYLLTSGEREMLLTSLDSVEVESHRQELHDTLQQLQRAEEYYCMLELRNNYNYTINKQVSEDLQLWKNVRDFYEAKKYIEKCLLLDQLTAAREQARRKECRDLRARLEILQDYQVYHDSVRARRRAELLSLIEQDISYIEATKALGWLSEKDRIESLKKSLMYEQSMVRELQAGIKEQRSGINTQQDLVNSSTIREASLQMRLQYIEQHKDRRIKLQDEITSVSGKISLLEMYDDIAGNKGMTSRMLYVKLLAVEDYINKIMAFSKYKVRITMEDGRNEITVLVQNSETGKWLSTQRLSGYEKLLLQVAFKRALNKYSYSTKCGLIILDEALDCLDQENFQNRLPDIINMITKDYFSCLAISQRDITHICDRQIIIRKHDGNSIID